MRGGVLVPTTMRSGGRNGGAYPQCERTMERWFSCCESCSPFVAPSACRGRPSGWTRPTILGHQTVVGEPCAPALCDVPSLCEGELYSWRHLLALNGGSWRREAARDPTI